MDETDFTDTDEQACAGIIVIEQQYAKGMVYRRLQENSPQTDLTVPPSKPQE